MTKADEKATEKATEMTDEEEKVLRAQLSDPELGIDAFLKLHPEYAEPVD